MTELREAVQAAPKSELHLHLRGAMPLEVLTGLLNKYSVRKVLRDAPDRHISRFQQCENIRPFLTPRRLTADDVEELFRYEDFSQFLATYAFMSYFVRDMSDLRDLISGVLRSLVAQNVVYAEIMLTVVEYLRRGITLDDIKASLEQAAKFPGIRVQWIADLVRDTGGDAALKLLMEIIELRCDGIVGITLGGSEHRFPPALFSEVYARARDHGLRLTVHAGEALGPQSVWDAIQMLGVERIGHGVRAIEDATLVTYLAENRVPLEVCPTSNLRTGVFPSYKAHSVKALFEAGVPITISSDDPTMFGTTLVAEYGHVQGMGVPEDGIYQMIRNGFTYAFLPEEEIRKYLEELEREWARLRRR